MLTTVVVVGATHHRDRESSVLLYSSIPVATCRKVFQSSETDNQALKGGMGIIIEVLTIAQNGYVQTTVVHIIYSKRVTCMDTPSVYHMKQTPY